MESIDSFEEDNVSKYGDKSVDIISRAYRMGNSIGDSWCVLNVIKYLERFIRPSSVKGGRLIDLVKAKDYIERAIEQHPDNRAKK